MINLIPKVEKRNMVRGFYYKLMILFLLTAGFSILIAFVAILPSYFLATEKANIVSTKLEEQKSEEVPLPDQQTLEVIKNLKNKLNLIENFEKNKFSVSQKIIDAIILKKLPDIKIIGISYENDPTKGKRIGIQGIAPSRDALLLFRLALENDSLFKEVNLPISNFIRGSNIQFSLGLIPS